MKIVIVDHSQEDCSREVEILKKAGHEVEVFQVHDEEDVIRVCRNADGAIAEYGQFTAKVFDALPNLKIVANWAMGVGNIDLDAAKAHGGAVANAPDYCFDEVAEHAMALIMALLRNIVGYAEEVKNHVWDWSKTPTIKRINGMTLGLISCGQIPRRVARMAQGVGMHVIGYDPFLSDEAAAAAGIEKVSLDELCERSDAVLSHVPLTKSTGNMINKDVFDKFRKKPVFVNTSRGLTVNEHDLCEALREGKLSRAALDVIVDETPDFKEEIFQAPNVFFTPHAAFYSETAIEQLTDTTAGDITEFFAGNYDRVRFVVKPENL